MLSVEKQESTTGNVRASSMQSITQILAGFTKYQVGKEWTDQYYFNTTAEVTVDLEATRRKLDDIAAEQKKDEQEKSHIGQRKQEALEQEKAALVAQNGLLQKQVALAGQQAGLAQQQTSPSTVGRHLASTSPPTSGTSTLASAWSSSRSQLAVHSWFAFELKRSKNKVEESVLRYGLRPAQRPGEHCFS